MTQKKHLELKDGTVFLMTLELTTVKARHASVQMYGCQTSKPPVKSPPNIPSADVWKPPPPI